jgi:hypothetical protein
VSTTGNAQGPQEDCIEGKPAAWGSLRKIGFRLLFCYAVLFGMFCLKKRNCGEVSWQRFETCTAF